MQLKKDTLFQSHVPCFVFILVYINVNDTFIHIVYFDRTAFVRVRFRNSHCLIKMFSWGQVKMLNVIVMIWSKMFYEAQHWFNDLMTSNIGKQDKSLLDWNSQAICWSETGDESKSHHGFHSYFPAKNIRNALTFITSVFHFTSKGYDKEQWHNARLVHGKQEVIKMFFWT